MNRAWALIFAVACACAGTVAKAAGVPAAILRDPPVDKSIPASGLALQIPSHGDAMNAMVYLPAGKGPHPVVVLLHGFPGNEQNLDLAQSMRRAGWAVITFHYRGSWGSAGTFTFDGATDDGAAAIAWLRDPAIAQRLRLDPQRVVVAGHSMGGYVAAQVCATQTQLLGCALIAPWDLSYDVRFVKNASDAERERIAREDFGDVDGRLAGVTGRQIVDILAERGQRWQLANLAPGLAKHPTLIVLASRDSDGDKALDLLPALKAAHAASLRVEMIDSDHSFNDRRIALQIAVLNWLATLPTVAKPR